MCERQEMTGRLRKLNLLWFEEEKNHKENWSSCVTIKRAAE